MFKMNMKNNLDERQEMALLKIESRGCWLAFWGLLIVMAVEMIFSLEDPKSMAGEWIVFMALALYLAGACKKEGIYDRHLKPNGVTNLVTSLLAGFAMFVVMFLTLWGRFPSKPMGAVAGGVFMGIFVFVVCYIGMFFTTRSFLKKQAMLEKEEDDADNMEM